MKPSTTNIETIIDRGSRKVQIKRFQKADGHKFLSAQEQDELSAEEPLEIRLVYFDPNAVDQAASLERSISVTMRTPGHDVELAVGFLVGEGIVKNPEDIERVRPCENDAVRVHLAKGCQVDFDQLQRNFFTSSSCGVCGKATIDAVCRQTMPITDARHHQFDASWIASLGGKLRAEQSVFNRTGGLHASALFRGDGSLIAIREDVGRHNALDKVIGTVWFSSPEAFVGSVLCLSGRISFELVQKAAMVGIPVIVAVGAPSTLAIQLAKELEITVVGFVRLDRFNVYTVPERITDP
ncbi:MAG: formate dehydrogenase accessory sulfurtransferase FdhD [Planctomycetota bacterium]